MAKSVKPKTIKHMKRQKTFFLFGIILLLAANSVTAQRVTYQKHAELDDILIEYRWQHERWLFRKGNAVLNLQITNLTESALNVDFVVAFYKDEQIIFESELNEYCFKPLQRRRAGRAGLRFLAEGVTMADIEKDNFSWDILIEDIDEVDECE